MVLWPLVYWGEKTLICTPPAACPSLPKGCLGVYTDLVGTCGTHCCACACCAHAFACRARRCNCRFRGVRFPKCHFALYKGNLPNLSAVPLFKLPPLYRATYCTYTGYGSDFELKICAKKASSVLSFGGVSLVHASYRFLVVQRKRYG